MIKKKFKINFNYDAHSKNYKVQLNVYISVSYNSKICGCWMQEIANMWEKYGLKQFLNYLRFKKNLKLMKGLYLFTSWCVQVEEQVFFSSLWTASIDQTVYKPREQAVVDREPSFPFVLQSLGLQYPTGKDEQQRTPTG